MNEDQPFLLGQFKRPCVSIVIGIAMEDNFAAQGANGIRFYLCRGHRHHDYGANAAPFRRQATPCA